jgi:hypothetical protein
VQLLALSAPNTTELLTSCILITYVDTEACDAWLSQSFAI